VDAHRSWGWIIRDNLIEGFWCENDLSEHAVHFWRGCRDTLVQRNRLVENARGVGFGLDDGGDARTYPDDPCPGAGYVGHYDGIIRNNFIFASRGELFASEYGFDCGVCLASACGAQTLHNTVASTQTPFSSIEWRWESTDAEIAHNLVSHNLRDRGGSAALVDNLDYQPLSLFVDGPGGDLHLAATAAVAINQVTPHAQVPDDYDGEPRPIGSAADIGADEYGAPAPAAVSDLRVTDAATAAGTLTATLRWIPPANAETIALRHADTLITETNWSAATLLTDSLPGNAETFDAVVPFDGSTVYFALKSHNSQGGWSSLSNNTFWPRRSFYLPLVIKED